MKNFFFMFLLLFVGGCATLERIQASAEKVALRFCARPAAERALILSEINEAIAPNAIRFDCANDK